MRRVTVIASLVAVLVPLAPRPASASCASLDLREGLIMFDGAFIGEPISRRGGPHSLTHTFTFRVERVLKGDIGNDIVVESYAPFWLEVEEGERVGLFVDSGREDIWWSGDCMQADPELLIEAAGPLPAPDGQGSVRFLVGVDSAGYRMLALDGSGRTLAYGLGEGRVGQVSVCPQARLAVEVVSEERPSLGHRIAVRHLDTFIVTREVPLPDSEVDVWDVSCRDPNAQQILVLVSDWPGGPDVGRLLRITPDGVEEVDDQRMRFGVLTDQELYVVTSRWRLMRLDPDSGRADELAHLPQDTWSFEVSPDRTMVAGVVFRHDSKPGDPSSRVFVAELDGDGLVSAPLESPGLTGTFVWVDEGSFAFFAWGGWASTDDVMVFDTSLRTVGRIREWRGREGVIVDGVLYGIREGQVNRDLVSARLPDGFPKVLRTFDSPDVGRLVPVPGQPAEDPSEVSPGPATPATDPPWGVLVALLLGAVALAGMRRASKAARSLGESSRGIGSLPE